MTREEAIEVLKDIYNYTRFDTYTTNEARTMAIKALEQEPCDDCVSRQAVLAIAGDSCLDLDSYEDTKEFCDAIKELPPVTPKREQGEWIEVHPLQEDDGGAYMCSKCRCGHPCIDPDYWKYCPNCGAEMR